MDPLKSCVGGVEKANAKFYQLKQEKEEAAAREDDEDDPSSVPTTQSKISSYVATDEVRSIHMWLRLIALKNMPISDVECKVMRESVNYPQVRSKKTVMDTGHHLVERVEGKIAEMMRKAPIGQLIFDGYTVDGVHLVGLFASFMVPYKGRDAG